jgi:maltooligosyltrehalose trehalohydrolase
MHFRHVMPFGAEMRPDGVRFRLWAPAQKSIALWLDSWPQPLAMRPEGEGWFELTTNAAHTGSRYWFRLENGQCVPDPASRFQSSDVHDPSVVMDPDAFAWSSVWRGRPWNEVMLYELHVGTFTPNGSFDGVRERLGYLAELGVTAIELMPIADFSGLRNWGYDGVLPFAPDRSYGSPDGLKRLIDAAHERGLMVILDVVYNHFGPDGNYLGLYAPQFFTDRVPTPWGPAIDYSQRPVRDFVIHNALYWLEEYQFDGLRLDAVHAIVDSSHPDILTEIAEEARARLGKDREIHLVVENDHNAAHYLGRDGQGVRLYDAQWNDDFHHVCHTIAAKETEGYYSDYTEQPQAKLARALAEGFVYQGERSAYRGGTPRGEPSGQLSPMSFVNFLQNHDQIGNRAFGERLTRLADERALAAFAAIQILSPAIPLIFMGEEWGAEEPFYFFCDFKGDLGEAVRAGRRREFAGFRQFAESGTTAQIPDPLSVETFAASHLDWDDLKAEDHRARLAFYRRLFTIRAREIAPLLDLVGNGEGRADGAVIQVTWTVRGSGNLSLLANLSGAAARVPSTSARGRVIYSSHVFSDGMAYPPWLVLVERLGEASRR